MYVCMYVCTNNLTTLVREYKEQKVGRFTWLEDFVSQFGNDVRDKVGIGVGEERHGRD